MMGPPRSHRGLRARTRRLEMLLFLAVSGVGVYALGSAMRAITKAGAAAALAWLAMAGAAMWILFSQMSRVHDSWPRRRSPERCPAPFSGSTSGSPSAGVGPTASTGDADGDS